MVIAIFSLAGCKSSASVNTANTNSNMSFEGFWELPDGKIFLFEKRACALADTDGKRLFDGIIYEQNNTEITVLYYSGRTPDYIDIEYTVLSENEVSISSPTNISGVWKRRTNLSDDLAAKREALPFLGYWESSPRSMGDILVLHITPWGWGHMYEVDRNYVMRGFGGGDIFRVSVSYKPEAPEDVFNCFMYIGDSRSGTLSTLTWHWVINNGNLLVGDGDDQSQYWRLRRKPN